jgi:hypothetical protein
MMSPIVTLTDDGDESSRMQVLLQATRAIVNGDFSIRLDFSRDQVMTEIAEAYNDVANLNGRVTDEFIRISEVVGREGNMTERASVKKSDWRVADSDRIPQFSYRQFGAADHGGGPGYHRSDQGRSVPSDGA